MNTAKNALGRSPLRRGRVCYEAAATSAPKILGTTWKNVESPKRLTPPTSPIAP